MRILSIGTNHKRADVALRERLTFDEEQCRRAMEQLSARWPDAEFVILSTCNRTEVYAARPARSHPRQEELRDWLGEFHGLAPGEYVDALYSLGGTEAAEHLFFVAAGLDSLVPGEDQIVAQVKTAYAQAHGLGAAGPVLGELFQCALHVAKHIRSETDVVHGKVSVASVAVEFVAQIFDTLRGKCVLNVGAGEMNELMLRHLGRLEPGRIVVVNRSPDRARDLAASFAAEEGDFERLEDHVAEADVVLSSTGSAEPVITAEMVRAAQARRGYRPLLIVDIAVPRDVDPAAGDVDDVFLYNIDDLDRVVRRTVAVRRGQRAAAEGIVQEHVEALMAGLEVRKVAPTIEALYRQVDAIAAEELADARNKLSTHSDAEEDVEILQRALRRALRRVLHPCVSRLRSAAGSGAVGAHVAAIRELFGLEEDEDDEGER